MSTKCQVEEPRTIRSPSATKKTVLNYLPFPSFQLFSFSRSVRHQHIKVRKCFWRENVHKPIFTSMFSSEGAKWAWRQSIFPSSNQIAFKSLHWRKSFLHLARLRQSFYVFVTLYFSPSRRWRNREKFFLFLSLLPGWCVHCVCESFAFTHSCVEKVFPFRSTVNRFVLGGEWGKKIRGELCQTSNTRT